MATKQKVRNYALLPDGKWKLMIPVFVGILTFLVTIPLMKLDMVLEGSTDVHISALHWMVVALMSAADKVLPLVAGLVVGMKYVRSSKQMLAAEIPVAALVLTIVYVLPLIWGYSGGAHGFTMEQNLMASLEVYILALIGCFVGSRTPRST